MTPDQDEARLEEFNRWRGRNPAATMMDAFFARGVPESLLIALRFYANGSHFNVDHDSQDFDTVSGEPQNWLFSTRDDDCTMIEDGSVAKAALCNEQMGFEEMEPHVDGEVYSAIPTSPIAPSPRGLVPASPERVARLLGETVGEPVASQAVEVGVSELERLRDALDHIRRTCSKSREMSRRIRWISARADGALTGHDNWKSIDLPRTNGESSIRSLRAKVKDLESKVKP